MSKTSMATRMPPGGTPGNTTDFVLHKSQQTHLCSVQDDIIDYTEKRLIRYAELTIDPQQKQTIEALIYDYRSGRVAVAWRRGDPVYVWVIKE